MSINQKPFFCSWSGGKDSCLAYYRAVKEGGLPHYLLTMMEDATRSKSHYLPINLLEKQAAAMGVPLISRSAAWQEYEAVFLSVLQEFRSEGIQAGVFGDIDLEGHKEWVEKVCAQTNLIACEPLWQRARKDLLQEFINEGFKSVIVAVKEGVFDKNILGEPLNWELIKYFEEIGIDPSGEEGEYHTVVIDGPIFSSELKIVLKEQIYNAGYWFQDITVL
ncbi:MAG: adenosine nucleotide hydrolase [Gracilibacter sp. BRH_c7a]|nr:MAG: adenosine nucleotide hydrolase [Gracilibacter sp. BRH_c7a]KUO65094.1 MAG: adenosine nucleotide hydrolase [Gracilibacter sp. BRH_c7a]